MCNGTLQDFQYSPKESKFIGLKNYLKEVGAEDEGLIFLKHDGGSNFTMSVFQKNGLELSLAQIFNGLQDSSTEDAKCCEGEILSIDSMTL